MNPPSVKYLVGDVRKVLKKIPEGSVHLVITSPPYYTLRDYKNPSSVWDETVSCEHEWGDEIKVKRKASDNMGLDGHDPAHNACAHIYKDSDRRGSSGGKFCKQCNAWLGCLGSEPSVDMFVKHLVDVGREIWRILRNDGIYILNLGDNYSSEGGPEPPQSKWKVDGASNTQNSGMSRKPGNIKSKNIIGVPFRVAFAMQESGWIWRSYMPWLKTAGMPDSTSDRPGSSIEFFHMFAKTNEAMYWTHRDKNGVRERPEPDYRYIDLENEIEHETIPPGFDIKDTERWKRINLWDGHDYYYDQYSVQLKGKIPAGTMAAKGSTERKSEFGVNARPPEYKKYSGMRNRRNVDWFMDSLRSVLDGEQALVINENGDPLAVKVNPKPFPEAHFAVWPSRLVRPFILSCTSEAGCCPHCGAPWTRVVEKEIIRTSDEYAGKMKEADSQFPGRRILLNTKARRDAGLPHDNPLPATKTVGWRPTCSCPTHTVVPCTVLDPFVGSGTTMVVAYHLGRDSIGIDVSKAYSEMALRRFKKKGGYQHKTEEFA